MRFEVLLLLLELRGKFDTCCLQLEGIFCDYLLLKVALIQRELLKLPM